MMPEAKIDQEVVRQLRLPLALVLFVFIGGLLVSAPKVREIFLLRKENDRQKKEVALLEKKVETLESLSTSEVKEQLELVLKALPVETNLPWLLAVTEQIAARHSLELKKFSLGGQDVTKSSFDGTLVGTQDNLKAFFSDLASTLPLLTVEEINLKAEGGTFKADFTLETFILSVEEKIVPSEEVCLLTKEEEKVLENLVQFSLIELPSPQALPSAAGGRSDPFFF